MYRTRVSSQELAHKRVQLSHGSLQTTQSVVQVLSTRMILIKLLYVQVYYCMYVYSVNAGF